jgi:hypothetical protein
MLKKIKKALRTFSIFAILHVLLCSTLGVWKKYQINHSKIVIGTYMLLGMVEDVKCPDTGTAFHPVGKFNESSTQIKSNYSNQIPVTSFASLSFKLPSSDDSRYLNM